MKEFTPITFNFKQYRQELEEYRVHLAQHKELNEQRDVLDFFSKRPQLTTQIASLHLQVEVDAYAFEYDIFGDFRCDLVVGSKKYGQWVFVEFEEAKENSIFKIKKNTKDKYQNDYSSKFEHGYSQIIDWFYKLDDQSATNSFEQRFSTRNITYNGMLIIGRDQYLNDAQKKRLRWREEHTLVHSKHIGCITYDGLLGILDNKLQLLHSILNS